jgi:hypothetical protein
VELGQGGGMYVSGWRDRHFSLKFKDFSPIVSEVLQEVAVLTEKMIR